MQEVANLGRVEQISNLMFGGNTEAAQKFVDKYSDADIRSKNLANKDTVIGPSQNTDVVSPIPTTQGDSNTTQNIDGQTTTGYNNDTNINQENGGMENVTSDRLGKSSEDDSQRPEANIGAEGEGRRTRAENERDFIRRITGTSQKSGRRIRNIGKSLFAYTEKEADGSQASIAVEMLRNLGIQAVYCDGFTESNVNGVTTQHSEAVKAVDAKLDISGKYLEISADDLRESYKRHSQPKEAGDIALSEDDFASISEHLNEFDYVLGTETYNGRVEIHIARETQNGYMQILTVSSNERNSVQVKKLIGVSKAKFEKKYAKKIGKNAGSLRGQNANASNPSTTAQLTAGAFPINSITQNDSTVNNNISRNSGDNSSNVDGGENQSYNSNAENNLTPEQKERYDAAILRYKSSDSYKINAQLREDEVLTEEEQEFVDTLDEALEQLPTYEGTVYRQITFDDFGGEEAFNEFLLEHTPGNFIFYEQYTSCSTAEDGYTVEGDYKVQLIVDGKNACDVAGYGNNMEKEVIFPRNTMFIVRDIDTSGQYPIIYLQEDVENGYNTNEEQGETVRDLQASHSVHGDMQGVSEENTDGNRIGQVRPQSASSGGQRNTVRAERGNGTLLSAKSEKQEVNSDTDTNTDGESVPTGGRVLDMPAITVEQQNFVKKIGKALGRNVEFVNMDKFLKEHDVNTEGLKIYPDGAIDSKGNIFIWYNAKKAVQFVFKHELTHFGERSKLYKRFVNVIRKTDAYKTWLESAVRESESWKEWRRTRPSNPHLDIDGMEKFLREDRMKARDGLKNVGPGEAQTEIIADFVGEKCFGENLEDLKKIVKGIENVKERNVVAQFFYDFFSNIRKKIEGISKIDREIGRIEDLFARMIKDANNTKTPDTKGGGLKYSFEGYAEDGKGKYKSNFPKGTPKAAKAEVILRYIQNVWSKKPIRLKIEENGQTRYIEAQFDPTYDESGNVVTDASKLMGGNRHGTSAEQRVTLDLADDYYQIASESRYNYSKDETGKDSHAHKDVVKWHYFVNDIYFAEYGSDEYVPYRVSINVKERADGNFVYSFSAEKQERLDTQRTLHAVVNNAESVANDQPSNNIVAQKPPVVKNNSMQESENYSSEKNDLKFSVPTATENKTDTQSIDFTAESVEKYTESQYNNFGWVRANDVLSATAYNLFKQKVAEIRTGVRFPKSRYGEYIIAVGNQSGIYNILVYTDGDINEPYIRKVIEIRAENQYIADLIRSEIYDADNGKLWDAVQYVKDVFGEENIDEYKSRDFPSFRQYSRREKRNLGIQNGKNDGGKQNGGRTNKGGGTIQLKFSMATDERNGASTDFTAEFKTLMQSFQNGEISQDEYMRRVSELYQQSIDENGQIPQGEMVDKQNKAVAVPKSVSEGTKVRELVRTVLESGYATPEMETFLKSMILNGEFSFEPTSDKARLDKAEESINKKGYQKALEQWQGQIH